jgi:very-short-patch-repair endonuclease
VLITRARECVHIVTSIPRKEYHTLPPLEPGKTPTGGWLLLAYLNYAEALQPLVVSQRATDEIAESVESAKRISTESNSVEATSTNGDHAAKPQAAAAPRVTVLPTKSASGFAQALAQRLAKEQSLASDVHWGNEGFCIDVAVRDKVKADELALGIMCDAARFAAADDPMQWDIFRTGILESQGWQLHRVWTPHFFRDPKGSMDAIASAAASPK